MLNPAATSLRVSIQVNVLPSRRSSSWGWSSTGSWSQILEIENLKIARVGVEIMRLSLDFSRRYGLLSSDAIHLATMQEEGITALASNDSDFERVEWLTLWKP